MNKDGKAEACPFCGSGEVRLNEILKSRRYVHCEGCGADGPPGRSVEEAWERWDERAIPLSPAATSPFDKGDDVTKGTK